jgi:hypothetical protein
MPDQLDDLRTALKKLLQQYDDVVGPAPDVPLTIKQFCSPENISTSTFHKMQRMDIGPRVDRIAGMRLQRIIITPADYKAWKKAQAVRQREQAEVIELERAARVARNTRAARLAVESPRHVRNRLKQK